MYKNKLVYIDSIFLKRNFEKFLHHVLHSFLKYVWRCYDTQTPGKPLTLIYMSCSREIRTVEEKGHCTWIER